MRRPCAGDEALGGGTAADRSVRAEARAVSCHGQTRTCAGRKPARAKEFRSRQQGKGAGFLRMPCRRRRGVLSALAMSRFGAGRRRGAFRRRSVTHGLAARPGLTRQPVGRDSGDRTQDHAQRSMQADQRDRGVGARWPRARRTGFGLRAQPRPRSLQGLLIPAARPKRQAAIARFRDGCGVLTFTFGRDRNTCAASSSNHSRNALNPACSRERCG